MTKIIHPYNYKEPIPQCPQCGHDLKEKKFKSGSTYRRKIVYDVCTNSDCNYKSMQLTQTEINIEKGHYDKNKSI